jgi:hypothetical protein
MCAVYTIDRILCPGINALLACPKPHPHAIVPVGGGACKPEASACSGNAVSCTDSKCVCAPGWVCSECNKHPEDIAAGGSC